MTKFFGGDEDASDRLVFGYNVTDALNLIIPGLVSSGDHVVTTNLEHNSVIRPVNHMVRDHGAEATFVPFDSAGFVHPDDIARAMRPNTKMVIVNHGSNVIGTVQPIKEIGRICREHGVTFVVDTAQTAGIVSINMKEMNIDVVAFTGHKALMGSMGIGGLCIRKHVEVNGCAAAEQASDPPIPTTSMSIPGAWSTVLPIWSAWRRCGPVRTGWKRTASKTYMHAKCSWRRDWWMASGKSKACRLYCCESLKSHLSTILINLEGVDPGDVGVMLDVDHNIATRTGLHCAPLVH